MDTEAKVNDVQESNEDYRAVPTPDTASNSMPATEERLNELAKENREYRQRLEKLEASVAADAAARANVPAEPGTSALDEFDKFCEEHYGN